MKTNLRHIISKLICWILLLQIFNVSINPLHLSKPALANATKGQDLSINEIDSIYELIAEGIYDKDVPETDEEDIDSSSPFLELFYTDAPAKLISFNVPLTHDEFYQTFTPSSHQDPHSPPPKQS